MYFIFNNFHILQNSKNKKLLDIQELKVLNSKTNYYFNSKKKF